tara:strand:+ start:976 stop:1392 length:417 start_codon:yes stop_codon:yes gene_type:complete
MRGIEMSWEEIIKKPINYGSSVFGASGNNKLHDLTYTFHLDVSIGGIEDTIEEFARWGDSSKISRSYLAELIYDTISAKLNDSDFARQNFEAKMDLTEVAAEMKDSDEKEFVEAATQLEDRLSFDIQSIQPLPERRTS